MRDAFERLRTILEEYQPFDEFDDWHIYSLPHPAKLPSPFMTMTLLGTLRYRALQTQAVDAYYASGGRERDEAVQKSLLEEGEPSVAVKLSHPEWSFAADELFGMRKAVHKATRHTVHVDTMYSGPGMFDTEYTICDMQSDDPADLYDPVARLLGPPCMMRSTLALLDTLHFLRDMFEHNNGLPAYEHTPAALAFEPFVEPFCKAWKKPRNRIYLAALVNDWITVCDLARQSGDDVLHEFAAPRAEICREIHVASVLEGEAELSVSDVLCGMHLGGVTELHDVALDRLNDLLNDEHVVEVVEAIGDRSWVPVVQNLLGRSVRHNSLWDFSRCELVTLLRSDALGRGAA